MDQRRRGGLVSIGAAVRLARASVALAALLAGACSGDDDVLSPQSALPSADAGTDPSSEHAAQDGPGSEVPVAEASDALGVDHPDSTTPDAPPGACPADMVLVDPACVDRYEAPNRAGELPFVMMHLVEAESWCAHRGKRLCFDDEWTAACEGPNGLPYPYGKKHEPGVCNDDKTWRTYNQTLLNGWPWKLDTDPIESLGALLDAARASSPQGKAAADHVQSLYQATSAGAKPGCVGAAGVLDLVGNVEEWTRRRDGGEPDFHGNLKGRYWAEPRTCQQGVTTHGDLFRFYEIGFRCCRDPG
jgi:formylglycine-generating enzyme required for sulfatase activity